MPEHIDAAARSEIMRSVKSQGNRSTEKKFATLLRKNKIHGWRRQYQIIGRPDFVFTKQRLVIFIDGCFWHGHKCKTIPVQNSVYWLKKIQSNMKRDQRVSRSLRQEGWHVIRIWECALEKPNILRRIEKYL